MTSFTRARNGGVIPLAPPPRYLSQPGSWASDPSPDTGARKVRQIQHRIGVACVIGAVAIVAYMVGQFLRVVL